VASEGKLSNVRAQLVVSVKMDVIAVEIKTVVGD
jgi:hypothetical protein